ncbi:MAG: hypothetical protein R3D58_07035 [Saprospiraceae bacterium]
MSNNGYFQSPCRKRVTTRQVDLDGNDFNVDVTAEPGGEEGIFNVNVTLTPKDFGDVSGLTGADNATLFDSVDAESAAGDYDGQNTDNTPASLTLQFEAVEQTEANVNSTWKIVVTDLQIITKAGQNMTIPILTKTFPSPL